MQTYDLTLKDLLMDGAPVLLEQAAGIAGVRLAPMEVPVIGGGRLDLFGDIDGETALHTEIQADNDDTMNVRMLGYLWLALRQRPRVAIRQMVLYVGRKPMDMPDRIDGPGIAYRFDLIDARTLRSEALLASDHPCDIIMAFFAAADDITTRVRAVVNRLAARFADDPIRLKDVLVRLTLLAPLRRAEPIVLEEIRSMPITIDLETHPFASKFFLKGRAEGKAEGKAEGRAEGKAEGKAEGRAEGKAEGRAEILLRLILRRHKTLPIGIEERIRTADIDQLDRWSERLIDGDSLADIFALEHTH